MASPTTPAMTQYYAMKEAHPEALLFFRMGDFYELFDEDARIVARELGLTLTSRNKQAENPTPMAGMPYHAREKYVAALLKKGYRIAIAEQCSDPSVPGIVERNITEVLTPGTVMQDSVLAAKEYNMLVALTPLTEGWAIAHVDVSAGILGVTQASTWEEVVMEVGRLQPKEILLEKTLLTTEPYHSWKEEAQLYMTGHTVTYGAEEETMVATMLGVQDVESLGLPGNRRALLKSVYSILHYLNHTHKGPLHHLQQLHHYYLDGTMHLQPSTIRNLELLHVTHDGSVKGSVLHTIDVTMTGGGGRTLRQWLLRPLLDPLKIMERQEGVTYWYHHPSQRKECRSLLAGIYDVQRIVSKLVVGRANGRDLVALLHTLQEVQQLIPLLPETESILLGTIRKHIAFSDYFTTVIPLLESALEDDPPITLMEGGIIRGGYDREVDDLRSVVHGGKEWLLSYQQELQQAHGIPSLKVGYNKVFGYYIEITKTHSSKAPDSFTRKQTLVNAERFITPELKEYEEKILHGDSALAEREYLIFQEIREQVLVYQQALQELGVALGSLDAMVALAETSHRLGWHAPEFHEDTTLHIQDGRHPVVEALLTQQGESFVPNHCTMSHDEGMVHIITGPNMAGKSTFLRQNALIVLLAQMGSYVPATQAKLPIVDQVFTRIGAQDHMARGLSTFMVEMQEAAMILRTATPRSVIILDEIGRGTSTYDGLSIAWAMLLYIAEQVGAKTLFATHYHELVDLGEEHPVMANFSVQVAEQEGSIRFLHTIVPGGSERSYGIEVAVLADMPPQVVAMAKKQLATLEQEHSTPALSKQQLSLPLQVEEQMPHPTIAALQELRPERLSPLEALQWIYEQQQLHGSPQGSTVEHPTKSPQR